MKIQISSGEVEILDVIPRSIVKKYSREIVKAQFVLGVSGGTAEEVKEQIEKSEATKKRDFAEASFFIEDAKEELLKSCITGISKEEIERKLDNYEINDTDIEKIVSAIIEKIAEQNGKKKDISNTSMTSQEEIQ